ncbi:MAG: L,D-transpeptidase [Polyangiaceae bacterium]|nr:L,D-transpeptidase [Polyangiaceae bacterium]
MKPLSLARRPLVALLVAAAACSREEPPAPPPSVVTVGVATGVASSVLPVPSGSSLQPRAAGSQPRPQEAQTPPREMIVVSGHAQVFLGPEAKKGTQIGYLKRGSKVNSDPSPVEGPQCSEGWLRLETVGYVCARHLSANLDSPQGKAKPPALDEILPYRYGHNVAHGTPLYRTVPSRGDMARYEPYLKLGGKSEEGARESKESDEPRKTASTEPRKRKKRRKGKATEAPVTQEKEGEERKDVEPSGSATAATSAAPAATTAEAPTTPAPPAPTATATAVVEAPDAGVMDAAVAAATSPTGEPADAGADAGEDDSQKPWWLRTYDKDKKLDVKLSDLNEGADKVLVKRMVKGFYVAIDHTFFSNGRGWHKTTTSLLAPADRLALVKPNEFHGEEIDEAHASHAVAFVLSKQITTYTFEAEGKPPAPKGGLKRYDRVFLSGKQQTHGTRVFRETVDGVWLRESDITFTEPGKRPQEVGPKERWIDVNLARQTLVAFEGDRPVFATLVSTGRKGRDKAHDHQTPKGMWRVREKHVAATMDGDGAAGGDLPYSIEDVPYVQYFHESYALHGAFWHDNFGRQQSHGCVNLAPLDARRLFFWADPQPPKGWFGLFTSGELPGSMVVVHD